MKKSRILISLMYLLLIAGCMGILHILDIQRPPQTPSSTEISKEPEQGGLSSKEATGVPGQPSDIKEPPDASDSTSKEGQSGTWEVIGAEQPGTWEVIGEEQPGTREVTGEEQSDTREVTGEKQSGAPSDEAPSDGKSREPVHHSIIRETSDRKEKETKSTETESGEPEIPKGPPSIILATDTHFYSAKMTDFGEAFQRMVAGDDGKIVPYSTEILEAFLDTVLEEQPSVLILSGDLTLNGEKANHEELAKRLKRVQDAGIPVLVIPGNHDINNTNAATYFGNERKAADLIMPEDFYAIYHEYGYDQAISRDESSLSYLYELDDENWLMMLDSCQYLPRNLVDGKMRPETLEWMEEWFEVAKKQGKSILPIAHHNLLDESLLYPTECTILNNDSLLDIFEQEKVPLYLSGHLHLQRLSQYRPEKNKNSKKQHIYEAVTASLMIPPCQYSRLDWMEDGGFQYETKKLDVASWAREKGIEDENLLDFDNYSVLFLEKLIADKIYKKLEYLPESHMESMSLLYSQLNSAYCAGKPVDFSKIKKSAAFEQWERNRPESKLFDDIMAIIQDSDRDNNFLVVPPYEE